MTPKYHFTVKLAAKESETNIWWVSFCINIATFSDVSSIVFSWNWYLKKMINSIDGVTWPLVTGKTSFSFFSEFVFWFTGSWRKSCSICSSCWSLCSGAQHSPTFYERLFLTKVICAAFLCLELGFVIFWQMEISSKAALKLLVKLTTGLNIRKHILLGIDNTGCPRYTRLCCKQNCPRNPSIFGCVIMTSWSPRIMRETCRDRDSVSTFLMGFPWISTNYMLIHSIVPILVSMLPIKQTRVHITRATCISSMPCLMF